MGKKRRNEPPILKWLEQEFESVREKTNPSFPYDKNTDTIRLPVEIEVELGKLILEGNKIQAVKRVTELTGAGLRVSKDYVDGLQRKLHG